MSNTLVPHTDHLSPHSFPPHSSSPLSQHKCLLPLLLQCPPSTDLNHSSKTSSPSFLPFSPSNLPVQTSSSTYLILFSSLTSFAHSAALCSSIFLFTLIIHSFIFS
eukprot:GCRY01007109.1.p1 GENE.GCRY01007109.1~~GCRY01007109.1.p1  ORF type:complete len:106 (+),score=27.48 GCRY01007109.1:366-683(+)